MQSTDRPVLRRPAVQAAIALILIDLFVLPPLLYSGPGTPPPTILLSYLASSAPGLRSLLGQWLLINLVVAVWWLNWWSGRMHLHKNPGDASKYGSHGTARFARAEELRSYLKRTGPGLILGESRDGLLILPPGERLHTNRNVTILGSSGSRKTRSFVQPNLLQTALNQTDSVICVDPKGENYRRSAALLREAGYEVKLLNFLSMSHSDRWNPLDAVSATTDAADLAVNLVANTINPNRPHGGDPFWDQAEQSFITALVLYVKHHRPEAEQHMGSVLELGAELHPNNLDYLFLALDKESPARRFYRTFLRADEKVRSGVVAGIGSRLQLWNIPEVVALTAASDFSLAHLGLRKMALFLVIPDSKPTYAPILALFWQQAFQVLYQVAEQHGGTLPVPVRCVMDEIANCGYIPEYAQKKSTMRSRRISTEEIWQSLGQIKHRYPQTWSELLANADHLLLLGANDLETAQYVSQLCGNTTLQVSGSGSTQSTASGSTSENLSYTGRPLLTPDECRRLPSEEALLFPKGLQPALVRKVDYTRHPLAPRICELEPGDYPGSRREAPITTDVAALLANLLPESGDRSETEPPDDPTNFLDGDPKLEGRNSR